MADNPNYPVSTAAISWVDTSGNVHLRVYSCDGYTVTERSSDPGATWTTGTFSQPGAAVSATCWQDHAGVHIRVYCTNDDQTIEWCQDPGSQTWFQGQYTTQ